MLVRAPTEAWKSSVLVYAGTVVLALVGLQSMWLPIEKIALSTGDEMTGFVLEEKTEWTTVLIEHRVNGRGRGATICDQGEFASLVMDWAKSTPEDPPAR